MCPCNFDEYREKVVKINSESWKSLTLSERSNIMEDYLNYIKDYNPKAGTKANFA